MRFLWIEDFDGGKSGKTEIKKNLERYFQLIDKNLNICTLEQALDFLEKKSNWYLFDAVLIDIRFKVCEKEKDEMEIYNKYFSSFLTKEKYQYYTHKLEGDANTASSGVLLYLALIHRYNYNQKRIAFVSANVDDTSDYFADINNMREFLSKAKYGCMDEDKNDFSALNQNVFELYMKTLDLDEELANEKFSLPETDNIDWTNIDLLFEQVDNIEKEMKVVYASKIKKNDTDLKYNSVRNEFDKVGLKVPIAFEKPGGSYRTDISWKFKTWIDKTLNSDYYMLRSYIVPICLELIDDIKQSKDEALYQPYIRSIQNKDNAKNEIIGLFSNIMELFPENIWTEKNDSLYSRIVKECVSLCESISKPNYKFENDKYRYACKSVLKIARNWTSHQGILGIHAFDVFFVYHILITTFIDLNKDEKIMRLDQSMIEAFCNKNDLCSDNELKNIIDKAEKKYRLSHKEAVSNFEETASEEELKGRKYYKYDENATFYDTISGIGHECSPIKRTVSMKHLYVLFVNGFKENGLGDEKFFEYSVLSRIKNSVEN